MWEIQARKKKICRLCCLKRREFAPKVREKGAFLYDKGLMKIHEDHRFSGWKVSFAC